MYIEIESYQGDTLLYGKRINVSELKRQLAEVEANCDRTTDHFIVLLCRRYGWQITKAKADAEYTYDRDTGCLLRRNYGTDENFA
ncbi:MAG: hypothetical protein IJY28_07025 [Clostridia bacterium]|nr:hypothetical protein [Clostridia bacterium]